MAGGNEEEEEEALWEELGSEQVNEAVESVELDGESAIGVDGSWIKALVKLCCGEVGGIFFPPMLLLLLLLLLVLLLLL